MSTPRDLLDLVWGQLIGARHGDRVGAGRGEHRFDVVDAAQNRKRSFAEGERASVGGGARTDHGIAR